MLLSRDKIALYSRVLFLFYMNVIFRYSDLFVGGRMGDKRLNIERDGKNWLHDDRVHNTTQSPRCV